MLSTSIAFFSVSRASSRSKSFEASNASWKSENTPVATNPFA